MPLLHFAIPPSLTIARDDQTIEYTLAMFFDDHVWCDEAMMTPAGAAAFYAIVHEIAKAPGEQARFDAQLKPILVELLARSLKRIAPQLRKHLLPFAHAFLRTEEVVEAALASPTAEPQNGSAPLQPSAIEAS